MRSALYIWILLLIVSCNTKDESNGQDIILAEVGDKKLYYEDISGPWADANPTDSLAMLNSYVEQWVRRTVVLLNAENSLSPDININKLVNDYRSSLLLHSYRSDIVEKKLDTVIGHSELTTFYDENKEQYRLSEPILKGIIVKLEEKAPKIERFYSNWKKDNYPEILTYVNAHAAYALLDTAVWYGINEFSTYLPKEQFPQSKLNKVKNLNENEEGYEYFVKIIEYVDTKDAPPLSYVEEKLKKVIINQRKKGLLERIETNLYKNALIDKKVKVYTK